MPKIFVVPSHDWDARKKWPMRPPLSIASNGFARHPVVTFVLMPTLALPLFWAAFIVGMIAFSKAMGLEGNHDSPTRTLPLWLNTSLPFVVLGMLLIPVAVSAAFFCRLAARSAVGWKWSLTACCILAAIGGMVISDVVLPGGTGRGRLALGLTVNSHPRETQVAQFAVPLAIGAWAVWQQSKRRRHDYAT